jgi:hypothetical protein
MPRRRNGPSPSRIPLVLLAVAACATAQPLRSNETVCPEYRNLTCLTTVECTLDAARGCQVCRCEQSPPGGRDRRPPPDQREAVPVVPAIQTPPGR